MSRWIARSHARQRFRIIAVTPWFVVGFVGLVERCTVASATSGIALFLPRIGVVVVPADLPVAGLVDLDELDAGDPLRALPEVEIGDQAAHRRAVLQRERLAVEAI